MEYVADMVSFPNLPGEVVLLFTGEEPKAQRGSATHRKSQKCGDFSAGLSDPSTADDRGDGEAIGLRWRWHHKQTHQP